MTLLETFDPRQQETIIRLPFRVGMWISQSDRSGGAESDAKEREALDTIVAAYAEDYLKSEFVQRVMEKTLARKADWPAWAQGIDAVPQECSQAIAWLAQILSDKDLDAFKNNLMDIGFAVAMAYGEEEGDSPGGALFLISRLRILVLRLLGRGAAPEAPDTNISVFERQALMKLARAMEVNRKGR